MAEWVTAEVISASKLNSNGFMPGDVKLTARSTTPSGWLLCDGSAVNRTTYADLFAAIGTAYGVGDGSTTFNVPNFLGRSVIGTGAGSGLTSRARGDSGGEETHIITTGELPAHDHSSAGSHTHDTIAAHTHGLPHITGGGGDTGFSSAGGLSYDVNTASAGGHTHSADGTHTHTSVGSGTAHNTMHPFGVATYIIKT